MERKNIFRKKILVICMLLSRLYEKSDSKAFYFKANIDSLLADFGSGSNFMDSVSGFMTGYGHLYLLYVIIC